MAPGDQRIGGPRAGVAGRAGRRRAALRIAVVDGQGRPVRMPSLSRWLARVAPASARGAVTVALATDARVRALNRQYRHKDHATDVLSFPSGDRLSALGDRPRNGVVENPSQRRSPSAGRQTLDADRRTLNDERRTQNAERFLGDIVIATGVARRQARDAAHDTTTELKILALHGLLHLLGYDHEHDDGQMARVEERLRRRGGLTAGLIERTGP